MAFPAAPALNTTHTESGVAYWFDGTHWIKGTPPVAPPANPPSTTAAITTHDPTQTYVTNQTVIVDGKLYRAIHNVGIGAFNPTDWILANSPVVRAYNQANAYPSGQIILRNNQVLIANRAIPANEVFDATHWVESAVTVPEFSTTDNYIANQLVKYNSKLYVAKAAVAAGNWNAANWQSFVTTVPAYAQADAFTAGQLVWKSGILLRANVGIPANTLFNPTQWSAVESQILAHNAGRAYSIGQMVEKDGVFYRAKANVAIEAWDPNHWASTIPMVPDHDPARAYAANEVMYHNHQMYRASAAVPIEAFNEDHWTPITHNIEEYSQVQTYDKKEVVLKGGLLLQAKSQVAAEPYDKSHWKKMTGRWDVTGTAIQAEAVGGHDAFEMPIPGTDVYFVEGILMDFDDKRAIHIRAIIDSENPANSTFYVEVGKSRFTSGIAFTRRIGLRVQGGKATIVVSRRQTLGQGRYYYGFAVRSIFDNNITMDKIDPPVVSATVDTNMIPLEGVASGRQNLIDNSIYVVPSEGGDHLPVDWSHSTKLHERADMPWGARWGYIGRFNENSSKQPDGASFTLGTFTGIAGRRYKLTLLQDFHASTNNDATGGTASVDLKVNGNGVGAATFWATSQGISNGTLIANQSIIAVWNCGANAAVTISVTTHVAHVKYIKPGNSYVYIEDAGPH